MGIVSCLGNDIASVLESLRQGRSGIKFNEEYRDRGFRSHVSGSVDINLDEMIDRKLKRFMGDAAGYAYLSMQQAIADSGLSEDQVSNVRTGLIAGSGGASSADQVEAADILRDKGLRRVGPYRVTRTMGSTVSACLATPFKIKGVNYSISSACATSAHCIGAGVEQIQLGKQDVVFAGGGEEEHWTLSCLFDAMGALSTKYNETPEKASRAYDANRDGFVIAGGGGMLVLEELEHAKARGAKIYAELTGFGMSDDAYHMTSPPEDGRGAATSMANAVKDAGLNPEQLDYIKAHGTSTHAGDVAQSRAVEKVMGDAAKDVAVSSTKSMIGHLPGAAGVVEVVFSILAIRDQVVPPNVLLENPAEGSVMDYVCYTPRAMKMDHGVRTPFCFCGTNTFCCFPLF